MHAEELSARVHAIDPLVSEALMQAGFNPDGVLREEQRMDVEPKRHRSVAEFADSVQWLKPAGHADLHDVRAKRADIRDHVDVSGPNVRRAIVDVLDRSLDVRQLLLNPRCATPSSSPFSRSVASALR